jgi:hypothetical protein
MPASGPIYKITEVLLSIVAKRPRGSFFVPVMVFFLHGLRRPLTFKTMQRLTATGLGIGYLLLTAAAIAFASPQKKNDKALLHCLNLHPARYCHLTYGNQP